MPRQSEVASRKRKAAPASTASAPAKKPKKITGPPPRSRPFRRPFRLGEDYPMGRYRVAASLLYPQPILKRLRACKIFDKLPKLKGRKDTWDDDEPIAVNGFDATKRHFFAAQAKWERAVEIMEEEGRRMFSLGHTLIEEAQASHKWVGQVGTVTEQGYHGRMKNFDAFKKALMDVSRMGKKAEQTVEDVKEPTKKWTVEFIAQRRAWDEEEENPTENEEDEHDSEEEWDSEDNEMAGAVAGAFASQFVSWV